MSVLIVPNDAKTYWPTLGWYVAEHMTGWDYLHDRPSEWYEGSVYGPGSLKGLAYQLSPEKLAVTLRAYELYPPGHKWAGRRRFKRVGISWRKGTSKTEWAAQIARSELHPEGPVRFDGWATSKSGALLRDPYGVILPARGRAVRDPYIPMLGYTEEQTEELAYGALKVIIEESPDAGHFDVGMDRILRLDSRGAPDGKAVALAGSPNANDGARTTFQHFDETHRMELPRLRDAHTTMLANIPKRPMDDPWSLETTTAGRPGADSVAERTHKYAQKVLLGQVKEPRLFFFHREAAPKWDMRKFDDRVEAIREATGPEGEYGPGQFEDIASQWDEPDADRSYLERVWTNRWTRADAQAFDIEKFAALGREGMIPDNAFCTLGFDGARFRDSTGLVLTEVTTGRQMKVGLWERPLDLPEGASWEVPVEEVWDAFEDTMKRYRIHKMYGDPPHWVETMADWAGKYPDVVEEWWTNNRRKMAQAARNYAEAIVAGQVHPVWVDVPEGMQPALVRHVGNAGKVETNLLDEEGRKLWILGKLRPEAKFDLCMAAVLSWQARIDAISDGAEPEEMFVPYRLDGSARESSRIPDLTTGSPRRAVAVRMGREAVLGSH